MALKPGKGGRISVVLPKISDDYGRNKSGMVQMRKGTADYFGLEGKVLLFRNKKNGLYQVSGNVGSGSIKVKTWAGKTVEPTDPKGKKVGYISLPVPPNYTIRDIARWLNTFPKNKPERFVTRDGKIKSVKGQLEAEVIQSTANEFFDRVSDLQDLAGGVGGGNLLGSGPNSPAGLIPGGD